MTTERIDHSQILSQQTKIITIVAVMLGLFLAALDNTIVNTALPKIVSDLNGLNLLSWVSTAYLLSSTTMVPIYGKLSDIYGRKPILIIGTLIFLTGSALCGLSGYFGNLFGGGMIQLIVFRAIQGLGAAALTSTAFAIIADLFPPAERAKYTGMFGGVFGLASVIGPLLGGFLTDTISWHWIFYVNIPFGAVALALIISKMPQLESGLQHKIDYLGAFFVIAFSVPLLLALSLDHSVYSWTSPTILGLLGVTIVSIISLIIVESKASAPIIPLHLLNNKVFVWGNISRFIIGAAFFAGILFLSLFMVNVVGVSATAAGTALIPLTVGLVFGAVASSQVVQRIGRYKPVMIVGLVITCFGFFWLSQMNADTSQGEVIIRMIVLGLGLGPALPVYTLAIQNAVPFNEIGVATSSGQFFQQMGSTIGAAVFGAILTASLTNAFSNNFKLLEAKLPPEMRAQFASFSSSGSENSSGSSQNVDLSLQIKKGIEKGFTEQYKAIEKAVKSGKIESIQALANNPKTSPDLKARLLAIDSSVLTNKQAVSGLLIGFKQGLNQGKQKAFAEADVLAKEIKQATRKSFASSITDIYLIGIFVVIAALLSTLMIPEISLRKTNSQMPISID